MITEAIRVDTKPPTTVVRPTIDQAVILTDELDIAASERYGFNMAAIKHVQQRLLPHIGRVVKAMSVEDLGVDGRPSKQVSQAILMADLMGRMSWLGPEYLSRFYGGTLALAGELLSGLSSDFSVLDVGSSFGLQWDLLDPKILPNASITCIDDRAHIIDGADDIKGVLGGRLSGVEFVHYIEGQTSLGQTDLAIASLAVQYGDDREMLDFTIERARQLAINCDTAHAEFELPGMSEDDIQPGVILPFGSVKYQRENPGFGFAIEDDKPLNTIFGVIYPARLVFDESITTQSIHGRQDPIRFVPADYDNHKTNITVYRNSQGELAYRSWALIPTEHGLQSPDDLQKAFGFWVTMGELWKNSHLVERPGKSWDANAILDTPYYAADKQLRSIVMATIPSLGEVPWLVIVAMIKRNQIMARNLAAGGHLSQIGSDQDRQAFSSIENLLSTADAFLNPKGGYNSLVRMANPPLIRVLTATNKEVADRLDRLDRLPL